MNLPAHLHQQMFTAGQRQRPQLLPPPGISRPPRSGQGVSSDPSSFRSPTANVHHHTRRSSARAAGSSQLDSGSSRLDSGSPPNDEHTPRQATRNQHHGGKYQSVNRDFVRGNLDTPHCATRLNQQLRYLENMSVPELNSHVSTFQKLFIDLLQLQTNLSRTARLHLLLEWETTLPSADIVNTELLSLFSTTVSNETQKRRKGTSLLGQLLFDFKLLCDYERIQSDNSRTGLPIGTNTAAPANADRRNRNDDGDEDIKGECYITPDAVTSTMTLPPWFPSPPRNFDTNFKNRVLQVDIDNFQHLSYDQSVFM